MSWWTDARDTVSDAYHGAKNWVNINLKKADNWMRENVGGDVYVGTEQPIDQERIDQYEQTMNPNTATAETSQSNWDWNQIVGNVATAAVNAGYQEYTRRKQNEFNAAEAQKQREYEERMSNTAYQRSIADMKAAGINPAVAFGGGAAAASTPSGGTATASNGQSLDLAGIISSRSQSALTGAQIENMKADTELKQKQGGKTNTEIKAIEIDNEIKKLTAPIDIELKKAQTKEQKAAANKAKAEIVKYEKEMAEMDAHIEQLKAEGKLKEAQAETERRLQKGIQTREWIKTISGALADVGSLASF